MPVAFLSADQVARYGRYNQDPTTAQLARYFYLDAADLSWIRRRRDLYLQMGLAVQLGTVRFLGTFLEKPLTVPECVITFMAEQLGYADVSGLALYAESETRFDHKIQIRERDGYRDFSDPFEQFALSRWLYARSWYSAESPSVLFDLATARLVERKVLLPGATTLERLVAHIRERTEERLWERLYNQWCKSLVLTIL